MSAPFAHTPGWVLEWFGGQLVARGARARDVARLTRRELRRLYVVAAVAAQHGPKRRLRGALRRAGKFGPIAREFGEEQVRKGAEAREAQVRKRRKKAQAQAGCPGQAA